MTRLLTLLGMTLVLSSGCNSAPPPETVATRFYDLCDAGRQNGFQGVQQELLALLSAASRAPFEACRERLAQRPDGTLWGEPVSPESCLVLEGFDAQRRDYEVEAVSEGSARSTLRITSGGRSRYLELVNEDGWKIDLEASSARNAASGSQP